MAATETHIVDVEGKRNGSGLSCGLITRLDGITQGNIRQSQVQGRDIQPESVLIHVLQKSHWVIFRKAECTSGREVERLGGVSRKQPWTLNTE